MKNISFDEMYRYVLLLREEEMGNNYKLSPEQVHLIKKIETSLKDTPDLKEKLDSMAKASSMSEIYEIYSGKKIEVKELNITKKENVVTFEQQKLENKAINLQTQSEGGRQYTKVPANKKAGYIDALVMALVTGFIGGIATTIIFMMIK